MGAIGYCQQKGDNQVRLHIFQLDLSSSHLFSFFFFDLDTEKEFDFFFDIFFFIILE